MSFIKDKNNDNPSARPSASLASGWKTAVGANAHAAPAKLSCPSSLKVPIILIAAALAAYNSRLSISISAGNDD